MTIKIEDLRGDSRILGPTNAKRDVSVVKNIARHHSATETGDVFIFQQYWNGELGWGTGGYHEIILRDGTVQWCYFDEDVTNGVGGHNTPTYHICLVGNGSFTEAQEEAFNQRAKAAMERFGLSVENVLGHNEFSGHASNICPGTNMDAVRDILNGGDGSVPEPDYIMHDWNKEMVVAADVLNVRQEPNTRSAILRQLTRSQVFHSARVTINGELVNGIRHWYEVDGNGWVSGSLVAEASSDNEWIERKGEVTVAISGGINLRGPSSDNVTNPTSLPILRRVDLGETFEYDKILVQKNGHAFARQSISEGYTWLAIGSTANGIVTSYWVTGIEI
ncbi:N-acetylmuramoyl-L-alanine amidase [Enterococcus mundtii]|uniref:N-acetylmuramoyl-L-alanine amidase n=1 Tax=Enterococcus mundtii TaxID=53346 RepID=UPI000CF1B6F6|nr:N-acetylmuramoyl-L-alanine amidase [Enterococcus mundtii]MBO1085342.1 amidase [Enterococcus mundtii]MDV7744643.1 N-acetylmuramoyl-L-alanine amidase [Enterococcus mundtii]PQC27111.1 N-acetylmuramoyl-L-alanine amidase [Enterococcus mundtii]